MQWLKKQAEFVTSMGVLGGALIAFIVFFGGNIPPWQTRAEAATDSATVAKLNSQTTQTLGKINDKLDSVTKRLDTGDCNALQVRLEQAQLLLSKNQNDSAAKMLRDLIEAQMRNIQGCAPF